MMRTHNWLKLTQTRKPRRLALLGKQHRRTTIQFLYRALRSKCNQLKIKTVKSKIQRLGF
jgi:hypothetical protein